MLKSIIYLPSRTIFPKIYCISVKMVYVTTTDPNHVVKYHFYKIHLNTVPYKIRLMVMISSVTRIKSNISFTIQDILPTTNVPSGQADAQAAATTVEYLSRLQILSKADKIRLSGIVCTIGKSILKNFSIFSKFYRCQFVNSKIPYL